MSTLAAALLATALASTEPGPVLELGSRVTGNQEQPRVLYILPWQAPDGPESLYQDVAHNINDLYAPVKRESFQRELELREKFDAAQQRDAQP